MLSISNFLSILLSLEFIIVSLYIGVTLYVRAIYYSLDIIFIFLGIIICEGVVGLCILLSLSNLGGSDATKLLIL